MAEERPLAESAYSRLLGVTGRYWQQSSYSKNAKFNGACSSCRPNAAIHLVDICLTLLVLQIGLLQLK
jgi:hypothetical protein